MTVFPESLAETLDVQIQPWNESPLLAVDGSPLEVVGMSPVIVSLNQNVRPLIVAILPNRQLAEPLLGNDLLNAFAIKFDVEQPPEPQSVEVDHRLVQITALAHPLDKVTIGNMGSEARALLETSLVEFADTFSRNETDIGRTQTIKHHINLTCDVPVKSRYYRIPYSMRDEMEAQIDRMKTTGAIRESSSNYSSPVFFVDKDHGAGKRLVADFRKLNAITIPDCMPMPLPDEVFGLLGGMQIFAKLDITAMFNQIEIAEVDVHKTAITTPFGLFECPLMPFGLVNAPATAVRLMRTVLHELDGKICFVYFDDIFVFAENETQLVERVDAILRRLRLHNLKLKPAKCSFAMKSVHYLGHTISSNGVSMDTSRIEAVNNFPQPKNPSDVRSFYGLCNYLRKFIRDFADIARPLTPLMGKPTDFTWTPDAQLAFDRLKEAITNAPVLIHFDPTAEHELRTDASSYAIGAVLYQKHSSRERSGVVLYYSKSMNSAQRNYCATDRELLAVVTSMTDLQHYLFGRHFTLVTDHSALASLKSEKDPHGRRARWQANLQRFDFDIVHKKGTLHKDADALSRLVNVDVDIDKVEPKLCRIIRSLTSSGEVASQEDETEEDEEESSDDEQQVDVAAEQREDPFCNRIIQVLESTTVTEAEKQRRARNFSLQNNVLYRIRPNNSLALVVPARRVPAILLSCHDSVFGAHLGFSRVYTLTRSRFYWPRMRKDIKLYVSTCDGCQRRKVSNTRRQGLIMPMPIAEDVFDTIGIDLVGPLPKSEKGFRYILVCTDNLSKYVITAPLKDASSTAVIYALFNFVIAKHGCPKAVLSDRGSNFVAEDTKDFFKMFGIKRLLTSAHHPQTNGQTERFNRTLKVAMTQFVNSNQKDWPDYLQAITFAYNISEHSVTKIPPFELVFGRPPRIPIENLMNRGDFADPRRPPGWISTEAVKKMRSLILANQQHNKRRLDKRLAECSFKVGDKVLVERPTRVAGVGRTSKLSFTYTGPYTILRKRGDLSFEIAYLDGRTGNFIIHPYHMRHYIERDGDVADDLIAPNFVPRERVALSSAQSQHLEATVSSERAQQAPTQQAGSARQSQNSEVDDNAEEHAEDSRGSLIDSDDVGDVAYNIVI